MAPFMVYQLVGIVLSFFNHSLDLPFKLSLPILNNFSSSMPLTFIVISNPSTQSWMFSNSLYPRNNSSLPLRLIILRHLLDFIIIENFQFYCIQISTKAPSWFKLIAKSMLSKFSLTHLFPLSRVPISHFGHCPRMLNPNNSISYSEHFSYTRYIELGVMLLCDCHYWNQDVF